MDTVTVAFEVYTYMTRHVNLTQSCLMVRCATCS